MSVAVQRADLEPMVAAPGVVVCDSTLASPELALVDAALAAELRRTLAPIEDTLLRPLARRDEPRTAIDVVEAAAIEDVEDLFAPIEDDAPVQDRADEPRDALSQDPEHFSHNEYGFEVIGQTIEHSPGPKSNYPSLPTPTKEAIEDMDAALREIRDRLTQKSPAPGRRLGRFRRRTTPVG